MPATRLWPRTTEPTYFSNSAKGEVIPKTKLHEVGFTHQPQPPPSPTPQTPSGTPSRTKEPGDVKESPDPNVEGARTLATTEPPSEAKPVGRTPIRNRNTEDEAMKCLPIDPRAPVMAAGGFASFASSPPQPLIFQHGSRPRHGPLRSLINRKKSPASLPGLTQIKSEPGQEIAAPNLEAVVGLVTAPTSPPSSPGMPEDKTISDVAEKTKRSSPRKKWKRRRDNRSKQRRADPTHDLRIISNGGQFKSPPSRREQPNPASQIHPNH